MTLESRHSPEASDQGDQGVEGEKKPRERSEAGSKIEIGPSTPSGVAENNGPAIERARGKIFAATPERASAAPGQMRAVDMLARQTILDKDRKISYGIAAAVIGLETASTAVLMNAGASTPVALSGFPFVYGMWKLRWQSLSAVDWFARKLNKWGDALIDRRLPVLHLITNPLANFMDGMSKALGLDTSLAERLKKDAEARKKLAEKLLKEFQESQEKYWKKIDEASKKAKRRKVIEDRLGSDVAAALIDDIDAMAGGIESKSQAVKQPDESAKAA